MKIRNCESDDISNLLQMSLESLGYPTRLMMHYILLTEEALARWKSELDQDSELVFSRKDTERDVFFTFSVKDRRVDPFSKETVSEDDKPIRTMYERLMSGIGTELKYRYRRGINTITLRLPRHTIKDTLFERMATGFVFTFALQILVQNIASNIDVLMLGFRSAAAMSGVSFASQIVLIHSVLLGSLVNAASPLFSQLYGQRKTGSVLYALRFSVIVAFVLNAAEFLACFLIPERLMALYTDIPELISEGSRYLKLVSVTFLADSFYALFYAFLRVIDRREVVTRHLMTGCFVNIFLNAVLIFGLFGLPALGVAGAALATVTASLLQLVMSVVCYVRDRRLFFFNTDDGIVDKTAIRKVFSVNAAPIAVKTGIYLMGISFMTAAVGRLNADIIAAYAFINTINSYIFSIKDGCGEVSTILVGIELGKNNLADAKHDCSLLRRFGVKLGLVNVAALIALVFLLRLLPFRLTAAAKQYLLPLTIITAINAFCGYENCINNGIQFAGGEVRPCFIIDSVYALCISVPISLLSIYTGIFPPLVLLFLSKMDEIVTLLPKALVTDRGRWLRNIMESC